MGIVGIEEDTVTLCTQRTVKEIGKILQDTFRSIKAHSVEKISSDSGALAEFDDRADIEIVARGSDFWGGWVVQVYVIDENNTRELTLVALGDSTLTRLNMGRKSVSISKSIEKRDFIANTLR